MLLQLRQLRRMCRAAETVRIAAGHRVDNYVAGGGGAGHRLWLKQILQINNQVVEQTMSSQCKLRAISGKLKPENSSMILMQALMGYGLLLVGVCACVWNECKWCSGQLLRSSD